MLNSVDANDSLSIGKFVDHTIFADFISLNVSTSEYSGLSIFACSIVRCAPNLYVSLRLPPWR